MNRNIFREYDIRGIYPVDINEDVAYTIGKSYGSFLQNIGEKKCLVGWDNRLSSPSLKNNLIKGILESGCDVVSCGLVTTPMLYYARFDMKLPGIMITASHNPKDDNGFKFSFDTYANARGEDVFKFRDFTLAGNFLSGNGNLSEMDIVTPYIELIKNDIKINRKLKVVIDCGNGTVSNFVKEIHSLFGIDVTYIYSDSDGSFPNHHPDPSVEENLEDLKKKVLELGADIGLSYDGDGDRIGVIDELGNFIPADYIMIVIVRNLLEKLENKTILQDVKCSKSLEDEVKKLGGIPFVFRTGASYTQAEVIEKNIKLGGEYSGHLYFNDRIYPNSCGIYAGLRVLEILSQSDKSFSELLNNINAYENYPEERIPCADDKKFEIVEKVKEYCLEKGYNVIDIDGVRVNFEDGWILVRASNTGPNLTTRFEAINKTRLDEMKNEFMKVINAII